MKEYRNKGFQDVISTANELADELDVPEENRKFSTKRTRRKKKFLCERRDEAVDDFKQAFKTKCFHLVLD